MARLCIGAWDIVGVCDIPAMTYAINAHLRRHDTYHSWFDYKNAENIVRRTIRDSADIEFVPTENGEMTSADIRAHILATPGPLRWDCFSFGCIQRADHFTFFMSVDHLPHRRDVCGCDLPGNPHDVRRFAGKRSPDPAPGPGQL
jgi:mycolipenoyl-CoA---2-(long-chain-fatty acyl)-trehalose mycolipenoyltransferase / long-chain-acyl-CoA---trehalose acyltransferase